MAHWKTTAKLAAYELLGLALLAASCLSSQAQSGLGWQQPNGSSGGGAGSFAPLTPSYATVNMESTLPGSRQLQSSTFLKFTDLGALVGVQLQYNTPLPLAWGGTAGTTAQSAVNNLLNGLGTASTGSYVYFDGSNFVLSTSAPTNGQVLSWSSGAPLWITPTATLPASAPYVIYAADAMAPDGNVLTQGAGITVTNGSAGTTSTIAVDTTVVRTSGAQTVAGVKTLSNSPVLSTNTITTSSGGVQTLKNVTDTIADLGQAQTFTGVQTFGVSPVLSTNTITTSGGHTATIPEATDTITELTQAQTLTNKTIQAGTFTSGLQINGSSNHYSVVVANPASNVSLNLRDPGGTATIAEDDGTPVSGGVKYSNGSLDKCTPAGTSSQVLYGTNPPSWGLPGLVSPMTTLGDTIYENSTPAAARLAGNTSATKEYLSQTGTGSVSANPAWAQIAFGDLSGSISTGQEPTSTVNSVSGGSPLFTPTITSQTLNLPQANAAANSSFGNFTGSAAAPSFGTASIGAGGTGATALSANGVVISNSGGTALTTVAPGANNNLLTSNGTSWISSAPSAGFSNPMTTLGDIIYENATPAAARLAGNLTSTKQYLSQTGTGSVSASPVWIQPAFADISGTESTAQQPTSTVNSVGNLAPLFNASISSQALSFSQLSAPSNTLFGCGPVSGAPSFASATVPQGGTGATSLAANGAIVMNSGGTAQTSVAPSTSGNLLTSNGTTWISQTPSIPVGDLTGTLPVSQGGTSSTSITANGVVLGNGTSAPSTVAPSTSGNVLTSNGTTWISSAPSGSAVSSVSNSDGTLTISPTTGSVVASIPSSVALSGSPTTTTQAANDNSTKIATTAYVGLSYLTPRPILTKSASYTLASTDSIIHFTTGSSALVATLPTAYTGVLYTCMKVDSGTGTVAVTPPSGTINGATSLVIDTQYDGVSCYYDSTNWWTP